MNKPLLPIAIVVALLAAFAGEDGQIGQPGAVSAGIDADAVPVYPVRSVVAQAYAQAAHAESVGVSEPETNAAQTGARSVSATAPAPGPVPGFAASWAVGTDVTLRLDAKTGVIAEYRSSRPRDGGWPVFTSASLATLPEFAAPGDPHLLDEGLWRAHGPKVVSDWSAPGGLYYQVSPLDDHRATVCLRLTITDPAQGPRVLDERCFVTDGTYGFEAAGRPSRRG